MNEFRFQYLLCHQYNKPLVPFGPVLRRKIKKYLKINNCCGKKISRKTGEKNQNTVLRPETSKPRFKITVDTDVHPRAGREVQIQM